MFIVPITPMMTSPIQSPEQSKITTAGSLPTTTKSSLPFADIFQQAISNVKELNEIANQDAYDLAMGNADDLHTIMINSAKAATALELTVQLTSKAVSAYNEIMKMQI